MYPAMIKYYLEEVAVLCRVGQQLLQEAEQLRLKGDGIKGPGSDFSWWQNDQDRWRTEQSAIRKFHEAGLLMNEVVNDFRSHGCRDLETCL
jgi:hypothetical protein